MEKQCNGVSMVIQLCKRISLRNPEDGDNRFSETSVRASGTRLKVPEDMFNLLFIALLPATVIAIR
jgi:hypothetical protein